MANLMQSFVLVALLFTSAYSFSLGGKCPKVELMKKFDAQAYLGKWFEYAKYDYIFEAFGKCITAEYGLLPNGNVSVLNSQISEVTGKPSSISGSARIVGPGDLKVTFPVVPSFVGEADYQVLGTDYKNYAVVWSCTKSLGIIKTQVLWILTREQFPNEETLAAAEKVILKNKLSLKKLRVTDQLTCPSTN